MPDRSFRIALAPLAAALALLPMLILGGLATPSRTLAACADASDPTCFVMTPTQGVPGATIAVVSYLTLDCPEPLQLKFFQAGEVVDDPHPSSPLLPTGAPNAFEFVVPTVDPGLYYVQPSCIPTQSFTTGVVDPIRGPPRAGPGPDPGTEARSHRAGHLGRERWGHVVPGRAPGRDRDRRRLPPRRFVVHRDPGTQAFLNEDRGRSHGQRNAPGSEPATVNAMTTPRTRTTTRRAPAKAKIASPDELEAAWATRQPEPEAWTPRPWVTDPGTSRRRS